ncbi:RNF167_2 [Blepharisma stoltei]|uniref:RING-type domain-containing protein n=1 Tax=Blepharisma stoltei TaxID=1481888 RepID=A0AAU9JR93_9CILI|nr:unnamed protein product [Blepharisma stoltei]
MNHYKIKRILLALFTYSLACETQCSSCSAFGLNWYTDSCSEKTCSKADNSCSTSCLNCERQPTLNYCLNSQSNDYSLCTSTSSTCGKSQVFSSDDGLIQTGTFSQGALCVWVLDLTKYKTTNSTNYVSLSFFFSRTYKTGGLKLLYYNLSPDYITNGNQQYSATEIIINNIGYQNTYKIDDGNYFVLGYFTGDDYKTYSGLTFKWRINKYSSSKPPNEVVVIVVVIVVSVVVFSCCSACIYKVRSTIRNARIHNIANFNADRARQYEMIMHNQSISVVSDDLLDLHLPKLIFDESLTEWGVKTCCICFEDFFNGNEVRKLICKHIYHSKCIEEWFKGSRDIPRCPVCKGNPFNTNCDQSELIASPQSPFLV